MFRGETGLMRGSYFLHPELRDHPTGLECVKLLEKVLPKLREVGVCIIWLYVPSTLFLALVHTGSGRNWGLEDSEIATLPASLSRCFSKPKLGKPVNPPGLGEDLGSGYGRILVRGEWNAKLFGGLDAQWESNRGKDAWVHKNR
jgi:hypothetical protein